MNWDNDKQQSKALPFLPSSTLLDSWTRKTPNRKLHASKTSNMHCVHGMQNQGVNPMIMRLRVVIFFTWLWTSKPTISSCPQYCSHLLVAQVLSDYHRSWVNGSSCINQETYEWEIAVRESSLERSASTSAGLVHICSMSDQELHHLRKEYRYIE